MNDSRLTALLTDLRKVLIKHDAWINTPSRDSLVIGLHFGFHEGLKLSVEYGHLNGASLEDLIQAEECADKAVSILSLNLKGEL